MVVCCSSSCCCMLEGNRCVQIPAQEYAWRPKMKIVGDLDGTAGIAASVVRRRCSASAVPASVGWNCRTMKVVVAPWPWSLVGWPSRSLRRNYSADNVLK